MAVFISAKYSRQVVVFCFCRVSNHEKKLEAVRSGVRAISVSGKMKSQRAALEGRHLQRFHLLWFLCIFLFPVIFCSLPVSISPIHLTLLASSSSVIPILLCTSFHISSTVKHLSSSPGWLQTQWLRHLLSQPGHGVSSSPLSSVQIHHPMVSYFGILWIIGGGMHPQNCGV